MARMTYITNTASAIRSVRLVTVLLNVWASPCKLARTVGGTVSAAALLMKFLASPRATPGLRLKKSVTLVNWFRWFTDRKSTRLNSSHLVISYAVFCLKKKKQYGQHTTLVT